MTSIRAEDETIRSSNDQDPTRRRVGKRWRVGRVRTGPAIARPRRSPVQVTREEIGERIQLRLRAALQQELEQKKSGAAHNLHLVIATGPSLFETVCVRIPLGVSRPLGISEKMREFALARHMNESASPMVADMVHGRYAQMTADEVDVAAFEIVVAL